MTPWIGVDLDGTLAEYHGWMGEDHIGKPIPAMVERIKGWLREGKDVRIFTARAYYGPGSSDLIHAQQFDAIGTWLVTQCGLPPLPITCIKDFGMVELWDDRAVQIITNTGKRADGQ